MVDVGLSQAIVRWLNGWYRRHSKPRGTADHFYRGTRLSYNGAYRAVVCTMCFFLLAVGALLFLVPDVFSDHPPLVGYAVKAGWIGIMTVAMLGPLQAFREFAVVNDEGVMRSNLFGRQTRMEWREINILTIKLDENDVIFSNETKKKVKLSLCYNGWQDFLELSGKHLHPAINARLQVAVMLLRNPAWEKS